MHRPHSPAHTLLLHDDQLSAERHLAARIADGLHRGDRVIHTHLGSPDEAEPGPLRLVPGGVAGHEQLELVSVADERARSGGSASAALAAYAARFQRAGDEGFPGVLCTADDGAWLDLVDDVPAFERGLHELAGPIGTSVVCSYGHDALRARDHGLAAMLAGAHSHIEDVGWSVTVRGDAVCLEGQLDETVVGLLREVMARANAESLTTIDLRGIVYLSPEAILTLQDAADHAAEAGQELRLVRIPAIVRRALDLGGLAGRPGVAMPSTDSLTPITGSRKESLRVASVFQNLAQLEEATSEAEAAAGLATVLAGVIGSAADLSVTIGPPANPRLIDSSGSLAQRLDGLQMQADEGPCQSAWDTRERVLTPDLRTDPRWPALTKLAATTEVASMLALPVRVRGEMVGVINAYSTRIDAFAGVDVEIAELAAFAVGQVFHRIEGTRALHDMVTNLRQALSSRSVIDQAKGILMARHGYDADTAFAALSELSQQENVKVRDLAVLLTEQVQKD
jgi:GAF domain-containing protein